MTRIELVSGDIARERVDAIVTIAGPGSRSVSEPGAPDDPTGAGIVSVLRQIEEPAVGVDAALRLAAGPELIEQARGLGYIPNGGARATGAGRLAARYVIHTATPFWRGARAEERQLAWCYRGALQLAASLDCTSVAFPALGTGVAGFPPELAAEIALAETAETLERLPSIRQVRFVCAATATGSAFRERLAAALGEPV